jgi:hypothetical protein
MRLLVCAVFLLCSGLPVEASGSDAVRYQELQRLLFELANAVDGPDVTCASVKKHNASFGFRENIYLFSRDTQKAHVVWSRGFDTHIVQQLLPAGHVSTCKVRVMWVDAHTSRVLFGSYDGCSAEAKAVQNVPHPIASSYSRWTTRREDKKEVNPHNRMYWELVLDGVMRDAREYIAQCRR